MVLIHIWLNDFFLRSQNKYGETDPVSPIFLLTLYHEKQVCFHNNPLIAWIS